MLAYEDAEARAAALAVIPVQRLRREADALVARAAARAAEETGAEETSSDGSARISDPISDRDALLLRALSWFKREFFTWCDAPACGRCGCTDAPTPLGPGVPTPEEAKHGASRVETPRVRVARLRRDGSVPAVQRPGEAARDARAGRCGEWANCFTLCCRALGFEARWVLDWTDHVWTEVYSDAQKRWLHCDPCEEACDTPKLYERGWGKRLSFVVAFGKDDVVDVTKRYVLDFENVTTKERRAVLPDPRDEVWVAEAIAARADALRRGASTTDPTRDEGDFHTRRARRANELRARARARGGIVHGFVRRFGVRDEGRLARQDHRESGVARGAGRARRARALGRRRGERNDGNATGGPGGVLYSSRVRASDDAREDVPERSRRAGARDGAGNLRVNRSRRRDDT